MKKIFTALFLLLLTFTSCSDEVTSKYSNRAIVRGFFNVYEYPILANVVNSPGQYASLRMIAPKIVIKTSNDTFERNYDAISQTFEFGLGGLIIGTSNLTDSYGNFLHFCYDLACPICDPSIRRLNIKDHFAQCPKCGTSFDLNNEGVIYEINQENPPATKRGLYQYRIDYDGQIVNVHN